MVWLRPGERAIISFMAADAVMTVVTSAGRLFVPAGALDHRSFLKWLRSGAVPEEARVAFIRDQVWIDSMPERAYAHNQIKTLVASVLMPLIRSGKLGVYFGDGMTFTSESEGFTTVPDGMFVSQASIDEKRVRLSGGKRGLRDTELVGTPDLIIEVVSDTSVDEDTAWCMSKYSDAGIPEYWVIDARSEPIRFAIHRWTSKGYAAVRRFEGWSKSSVLDYSFRFVPGESQLGHRTYDFEHR